MKCKLKETLKKRFKGHNEELLAKIILFAVKKDKIRYEEIKIQDSFKVDLLMLLEKEKILIPLKTSKTLAWEDRILTFKPGEIYEIPHVIRYLIRKADETGEWNPDYAVKSYLKEIGEPEPEKITTFFNKVKENMKQNKITPEILIKVSDELNLRSKIGTIIAELKGGGIISPCLRDLSQLRYEVNPSLII